MRARASRKLAPSVRLGAILSAGLLSGALLTVWSDRVFAEEALPGFAEVTIEPAAPVIVPVTPAPPAVIVEAPAPAAAPIIGEADGLALPAVPQIVVEIPPAEAPPRAVAVESVPAPQMAEAPPVPKAPSAGEALSAAIQAKVADPTLPLPPKFAARDREGLAASYVSGEPLWIKDGAFGPAAEAVVARLERADEDGLDPADYPVPNLAGKVASAADLAEAEIKLSAAAYLYARDARGGRIEPNRLGGLITPKLDLPGVERVLATLAGREDPGSALQGFNPRYPGYAALREKLADIRAHRPAASAKNQRGGTVVASTGSVGGLASRWSPRLESDLVANMERWRWLPAHVGERYLLVNIPEYRLRLFDEGRVVHETRVIIGKPQTPTPVFSDMMDHAVVNPSWFVPPSILKKMNVETASQQGYHVTQRRGVTSVRMPPGPRNALGNIKFMFPNDHAVYLHDTPNRGLFGGASRALSHGCVRVQNPFELAGKIIGSQWSESRLRGMIGYGERTLKLEERMPIHLSYFTLWVDEYGDLKSFGDVYGHNARTRRALGLGA